MATRALPSPDPVATLQLGTVLLILMAGKWFHWWGGLTCAYRPIVDADSKSKQGGPLRIAEGRQPARRCARSALCEPAGWTSWAMSGLSGGSTATRACTGSSISRNRTAAAHDQPSPQWARTRSARPLAALRLTVNDLTAVVTADG